MRMTKRRVVAAVLALLFAGSLANAEGEQPRFKLRCQVFRISSQSSAEVQTTETIWNGKPEVWEKIKNSVALFTKAAFRFGADTLNINDRTVSWNKEKLSFDGKDKARGVTDGLIKLIYSTEVELQKGKTGSVFIAAKQPFEYFERREDGLFELKEIELPAGLDLEVKPREFDDKNINLSNVTIRLRAVTERETIPGVKLPIGRPVLQTEEFKLSLKVRDKGVYWIQVRPQNGDGSLLVSLEAQYI
jgi:hypothetical protein